MRLATQPDEAPGSKVATQCVEAPGGRSVVHSQAAGLSRCLTKVQESMVTHLKTLYSDKGKGKTSGRSQHAVDELNYLVTFHRSITQAMPRTMQDVSEGILINMANLTLTSRDSYLNYLRAGVKQDTLTALRNALLHMHSLFLDQLLVKVEEEISHNEESHSTGTSQKKPSCYHPYASSTKPSHESDRKTGVPAWKQIKYRK